MSRRSWSWLATAGVVLLLVIVAPPAVPENEETAKPEKKLQGNGEEVDERAAVESILREQQKRQLAEQHFSYEPAGRRDPFLSLMTPRVVDIQRPPGVAGMLVAELDLAGVVRDNSGGDVAMVIGSDNKGYFLRVGDEVFDGTVLSVDSRQGAVTFRQEVDDPRLIKPYRDVVKRLVPLEGSTDE